ncbi:MAG: TetR/AcrR family transcriptional regulator [Ottowia sp.]|nr:TetR/AcrR family transcriptional regulator [Ottowia sp.]
MQLKHFSDISAAATRVVDAAERLIQVHGYNGFSYDDISREIGIKKPSIHHHFATKAELVRIVIQRYTDTFRGALNAIEISDSGAIARLFGYVDLFSQTYEKDQRLCVCGMLGAEVKSLSEAAAQEVQSFFQMNLDWLTKIIRNGSQSGELRFTSSSPEAHAYALLSTLEGAMIVGRGLAINNAPALAGRTYISNLPA